MKNPDFYNALSQNYDSMLNFESALQKRSALLRNFIRDSYKYAVDIGCGTGLDSISLALGNLKVTAYDTSGDMVAKARRNAAKRNLNINFINAPYSVKTINKNLKPDIILSLGNAFANIKEIDLKRIINLSYRHLNHGGIFLFQVLNYDLIRKENKRIVNITGKDGTMFVRFYDFVKDSITFNILSFGAAEPSAYSLISTPLYGYNKSFFSKSLKPSGYKKVKYMSDFTGAPFNPQKSKDLIILAEK